jgi:hypothetical protein
MKAKLIVLAAAALGVAILAYVYFMREPAAPPEPEPTPAQTDVARTPEPPRYPVPAEAAPEPAEELPPLDESDAVVRSDLLAVLGDTAGQLVLTDNVLRRIVATVDGLARPKLAVRMRPVTPAPGGLVTDTPGDDRIFLAEGNYARYDAFVKVVAEADPARLAQLYFRYYPRFQQAYADLGYENAYFNDRLVAVIDDLLETPDVEGPIELVRSKVMYEYADPDLERRSVGQKTLLRMGPENAAIVKTKLRQLRMELTSRSPDEATSGAGER